MARRADRSDSGNELQELVIWFPGPDGEPIEPSPPLSAEEVLRNAYGSLAGAVDQVKDRRATPGFRPGGVGDRPDRRGVLGEVITPVLVRPSLAAAMAVEGALFSPPLPGMTVDDQSLDVSQRGLTWQVTLRTGLVGRRQATLRIQPSPSANLTIIELIPNRPKRLRARAFVRAGINVIDQLSSRLRARSRLPLPSPLPNLP